MNENVEIKKHSIKDSDFVVGLKKGMPIGLGYIPVSFSFGILVVSGGLSPLLAVFISFSNLTSAGQFAGTKLILQNAAFIEIALTTLVINLRYMLMSLALSQKLKPGIGIGKRLIFSFGITDETYAIAATYDKKISASFMFGLITAPIIGWSLGTFLGAFMSTILPDSVCSAMGIALYGMFIAIFVPAAKKSKGVLFTVLLAVGLNILFKYTAYIKLIPSGFRIIIVTIVVSFVMALLMPRKEED